MCFYSLRKTAICRPKQVWPTHQTLLQNGHSIPFMTCIDTYVTWCDTWPDTYMTSATLMTSVTLITSVTLMTCVTLWHYVTLNCKNCIIPPISSKDEEKNLLGHLGQKFAETHCDTVTPLYCCDVTWHEYFSKKKLSMPWHMNGHDNDTNDQKHNTTLKWRQRAKAQ
jgi:hypothetical protein